MGAFEGRVALVTGAARGIGRAVAERLGGEGARVVVADRDEEAGRSVVKELEGRGAEAAFVPVDVADEASVDAMVTFAVERFGKLDAAINNAGISDPPRAFVELSTEAWERMIAVNLSSVFFCLRAELRQMLGQPPEDGRRGAIVNVSSGAGIVAAPGQPHYTAAKHGVLGLTKAAAQEYAGQGLRVNAICPGATETPMMLANPPGFVELMRRTTPGGELGRPEDVAAAAVWLCSPDARWVNGQSLVVDGGGVVR